jgi:hypothetical protein
MWQSVVGDVPLFYSTGQLPSTKGLKGLLLSMFPNNSVETPVDHLQTARKHFVLLIFAFASALSLLTPGKALSSGVVCSPQVLFGTEKERSVRLGVYNPSDISLEVWVDVKYGYTTSNDTGKVFVVMPDSLQPDDRSAASWIKAFPIRFILGPNEMQTVRLLTSPPPGTAPGEDWARVLVSSKDQTRPFVKGKKGFGSKVDLISVASVPFQYKSAETTTGLQLTQSMDYKLRDSTIDIHVPLRRLGNASYWGTVECKLVDGAGKTVYTATENLAVFKDLLFTIKLPRLNIPSGAYTLNMVSQAVRSDVRSSYLTRCAPITWSLPIVVQ